MAVLTRDQITEALRQLPSWSATDVPAIQRKFTFGSFPDALAFVLRLGLAAEAADHHPDLFVNFKRVTVTFSTHSEGGVTSKDLDGAREADRIAGMLGGV